MRWIYDSHFSRYREVGWLAQGLTARRRQNRIWPQGSELAHCRPKAKHVCDSRTTGASPGLGSRTVPHWGWWGPRSMEEMFHNTPPIRKTWMHLTLRRPPESSEKIQNFRPKSMKLERAPRTYIFNKGCKCCWLSSDHILKCCIRCTLQQNPSFRFFTLFPGLALH